MSVVGSSCDTNIAVPSAYISNMVEILDLYTLNRSGEISLPFGTPTEKEGKERIVMSNLKKMVFRERAYN